MKFAYPYMMCKNAYKYSIAIGTRAFLIGTV